MVDTVSFSRFLLRIGFLLRREIMHELITFAYFCEMAVHAWDVIFLFGTAMVLATLIRGPNKAAD